MELKRSVRKPGFTTAFLTIILATTLINTTSQSLGQIFLPQDKEGDVKIVYLRAYQFGFAVEAIQEGSNIVSFPKGSEPSVLELEKGDRVLFRIVSSDITHGFYIDGYTPPPEKQKLRVLPGMVLEVGPITFDKVGKYKIRCSVTCGPLHPFMVSDIVVKPNLPYYFLLLSTLLVGGVVLLYLRTEPSNEMLGVSLSREIDLFKVKGIGSLLKKLTKWRGTQFTFATLNLFVLTLILVAGFIGNPTGNRNFSTTVVWILWFALVEFMILLAARFWCTVCPLPVFGEWLARRRLIGVNKVKSWFYAGKWPESLNNMWIPALGFLGLSLIVPWLVTRPVVTALVFLLIAIIGTVIYLLYPRRYFCRHICPASGYIGYHSNASIFSIRSKDRQVCSEHRSKDCIKGNNRGYGCPWSLYPGGITENTYCGQCLECFKSCPLDNMTMKVRMIGKDLVTKAVRAKNRFDEAWMGFIRFTLAIFYELVFFGSFAWLREWGNMDVKYGANLATAGLLIPPPWGIFEWFIWAFIVSSIALVIYPGIFYIFSTLSKKMAKVEHSARKLFLSFSYALAPYGLFIWIAFAVNLLLVFWAYPFTAFFDPFGWGWSFGPKFEWNPPDPGVVLVAQIPLIFFGLGLAINTTYNIARELFRDHRKAFISTVVMGSLHTLSALLLIWIIAG